MCERKKKLLVSAVLALAFFAWAQDLDTPEGVLEAARAVWRGETFHAVVRLEVAQGGETKVYRLEVWTHGETQALIRILAPEDEAGSGYLLVEDRLWYYSPQVGQPLLLPPVVLHESLFGSGLDLDEILRGTTGENFAVEFAPDQPAEGYKLVLTPLPGAPIVYGKLVLSLKPDLALEEVVYYDQRGQEVKTARAVEFLELTDRVIPKTIVIQEAAGDRTVQTFETIEINLPLDPELFTLEGLIAR